MIHIKSLILSLILSLFVTVLKAQIGIGNTNPQGALDITSTNQGLLIPRVSLTANTDAVTVLTPTISELVYNTNTSAVGSDQVTPGYYYWNGSLWIRLASGNSNNNWSILGNADIVNDINFMGTTNDFDVAFRRNNLAAGKIGLNNTSFGVGALANIIPTASASGRNNVAFGTNALGSSVNGVENVAVGSNALSGSTASGENSSVGYANIAVGYNTLTHISPGNDNVAIGWEAARDNRASKLIAIGYRAGWQNVGLDNIAIGDMTLSRYTNDASRNNVAIGTESMSRNSGITVSQNVAIGFHAGKGLASSNNVVIGSEALIIDTSAESVVAIGEKAMNQTAHSFSVAIGKEALFNSGGMNNIAIGYRAARTGAGSNNIVIGSDAAVSGNNQIIIGSGPLQTATINAAGWSFTSDRRLKTDIKDSPLGLDFIRTLRPVSYYRIDDDAQKTEFGFIAQEIKAALETTGRNNIGILNKTANGMLMVRYNDFLPITIKAVQEQQEQIEALKTENELLKKANEEIIKRLEALEKK